MSELGLYHLINRSLAIGLSMTTALLAVAPAHGNSLAPLRCQTVFTPDSFKRSTLNYLYDVKASLGLRLILRQTQELSLRRGGLLEASDTTNQGILERLHYLLWKAPLVTVVGPQKWLFNELDRSGKYELAPLGLLREQMLARPVRFATSHLSHRNLEPSAILNFAFDALVISTLYSYLDSYFESQMAEKESSDLQKQRSDQNQALEIMIKYDRRYLAIKTAIENKVVSEKQGTDAAFVLTQILRDYYEETAPKSQRAKTPVNDDQALSYMMFSDILNMKQSGLKLEERYRPQSGFQSQPSEKQIHQLIVNRQMLLSEYDAAARTILDQNSVTPAHVKLTQDPFFIFLKNKREKNTINSFQMLQYFQESLYWQHRLQDYQILRIERLQQDADIPVSLETFQNEIKEEIENTTQPIRRNP